MVFQLLKHRLHWKPYWKPTWCGLPSCGRMMASVRGSVGFLCFGAALENKSDVFQRCLKFRQRHEFLDSKWQLNKFFCWVVYPYLCLLTAIRLDAPLIHVVTMLQKFAEALKWDFCSKFKWAVELRPSAILLYLVRPVCCLLFTKLWCTILKSTEAHACFNMSFVWKS